MIDRGKTLIGVLGGLVSALALVAGAFAVLRALRAPAPAPVQTKGRLEVTIAANVPGSQILVDGNVCGLTPCKTSVGPGVHQAEARKPAYSGESREFVVNAGEAPAAVELNLQALPASLEFSSDLASGRLQLDSDPPLTTAGGSAQFEIPTGSHKLRFTSGAFEASFAVESQPGSPPRLLEPPSVRGLRAIVVAGAGPLGRLWSSEKQAELMIGARELGLIPDEGIALPALDRGSHKFILKRPPPAPEIDFAYEIAENPTLWISLRTNRKLGTLQVMTGLDDVTVLLDGKATRSPTRRGGRALLLVPPGDHEVRVEKPGFVSPATQRVSIREGGEAAVEFRLDPTPTRASLAVVGAPPGAAVLVDGKSVATTGLDGAATVGDLEPGPRVVTIRKAGYQPGRWDLTLVIGRNGPIRAALQRASASLRITVEPAGGAARLTLRRTGKFEERAVTEKESPILLSEGDYTVTAIDAAGQRRTLQVKLEAGKESLAAFSFGAPPKVEAPAPAAAAVKVLALDGLESSGGWKRGSGGALTQEGDGIFLLPTKASSHAVTFTAHIAAGRAIRWVTQFRDVSHYTLYEFGSSYLERVDVIGGRRLSRNRSSHASPPLEAVTIRMLQQNGVLRTSAFLGGQWVDLDTVEAPQGTGRFGFYVTGRDRPALTDFRYEYR